MSRRWIASWCALLTLVGSLWGFEAVGTIKKIDAEKGVVVIQANDRERTVKVDKAVKVLDAKGNELADGLKAKELKEGVQATFTVERENNEPVIKVIRLGKKEAEPPATGKKAVGFKPLTVRRRQERASRGAPGRRAEGVGQGCPPGRGRQARQGRQDRADLHQHVQRHAGVLHLQAERRRRPGEIATIDHR